MMALAGVPLFFSGFWSKDEILHAAPIGHRRMPRFTSAFSVRCLTAFYMTRQMCYVFFGDLPGSRATSSGHAAHGHHHASAT